ncbi:hypothetical protein HDZ31DRAFT_3047, partial [Schizophyllum fasciatum]
LELNIHQKILSEIAALAADGAEEECDYAQDTISTKLHETEDEVADAENSAAENDVAKDADLVHSERVFMPASRVHCNIGFGELVINFPDARVATSYDTLLPTLIGIVKDIPRVDFDKSLYWQGKGLTCVHTSFSTEWSLPDQLTYSTVSALLRVAAAHPEAVNPATEAIVSLVAELRGRIDRESSLDVLTQIIPALHGFYRAVISTSFPWTYKHWHALTVQLSTVCAPAVVDRLNNLLGDIMQKESADEDTVHFLHTFLGRYLSRGR